MTDDTGQVVTVNGRIDPEDLGITLTHEHVFCNWLDAWYEDPASADERRLANEPVSLETLPYIRRHQMSHKDNVTLDSYEDAIDEVSKFYNAGGKTIVDLTPKNTGQDPEKVQKVSRATGVQIIHGTTFYVRKAHPDRIDDMSVDDIENEFVTDVLDGFNDTNVRAGIVGEIGLSDLIYEEEERVLRAGVRAALKTGAPLTIHPPGRTIKSQQDRTYPTSRWCLEVLDIVEEEGLSPERVVMDHMDRTLFEELSYQKELAERGPYLEYDLWGTENYINKYNDSYPSDGWRTKAVIELIEEGYADQILFAHDTAYKTSLTKYGGFGYAHILENVVPMLKERGVDQHVIDQILVENPKRLLTFVEPEEF